MLRKVHGLSQREVAQHMGISESTVEKHIGKGLRLLLRAAAAETTQAVSVQAQAANERAQGHDGTAQKRED